jgi:Family of unknown function (DUF5681)
MSNAVNNVRKQRGRPFLPGQSGNPTGRPKGARNKRTRDLVQAAQAGGELPVDFLLRTMRDENQPIERRLEAAKSAAPYLHPKISTVEHSVLQADENKVTNIIVEFVKPEPGQNWTLSEYQHPTFAHAELCPLLGVKRT